MNGQMNGDCGSDANANTVLNQYGSGQNYKIFRKQSDINGPAPVDAWVFIDEHPDSINDALFHVDMKSGEYKWSDWPASNHGDGSVLAFADGHAEAHRWIGGGVSSAIANLPVKYQPHFAIDENPNCSALAWLQQHTTALP
jgi:prepilin-type processing-associated H-X9-DG protein